MRPGTEQQAFGPAGSLAAALWPAPVAAALIDAGGHVVAANQELARLVGRAAGTLASMPFEHLFAGPDGQPAPTASRPRGRSRMPS